MISALAQPELSNNILRRLWAGDSVETIYEVINNSSNVDNQLGRLGLQGSQPFDLQNEVHDYRSRNVEARDWEGHAAAMSSPPDVMSTPNVMLQTTALGGQSSRERNSVLWPFGEPTTEFAGLWSIVTSDTDLIQHPLALYLCWEYPTFASLSKEHHLRDFRDGRSRHRSSLLINALFSLSCRFSHQHAIGGDSSDCVTLGEHFFRECQ